MSYFISSNALSLRKAPNSKRDGQDSVQEEVSKILEAQTSSSNKSMDTWQLWAG